MLSSGAKFVVLGSLGIGFLEPGVAMILYFEGFCCVCMLKFCELPFCFNKCIFPCGCFIRCFL